MLDVENKPSQRSIRKQVLLCGTRYGQSYLSAIDESGDFDVCALLARGSQRSIRISEQRAIPLYKHVEELGQGVDLACVAVGGVAGSEIAADLLKRGIPVLIEHPLAGDAISHLLELADSHNTVCHINSHFPLIEPVAAFIALCQKLNRESTAHIVHVSCNSRTLFSTLDILTRCFGESQDEIPAITSVDKASNYLSCILTLGSSPCSLLYQRWRGYVDDSRDSPLGHEITVTYPEGVLRLGGTFGPCQWFPLAAAGFPLHLPICDQYGDSTRPITNQHVIQWRKQANLRAMRGLSCAEGRDPYQQPAYLMRLCRQWHKWFAGFGTVEQDIVVEGLERTFTRIQSILEI